MFYFLKWCHGFLNALALLVMAAGVVVGSVRENSFVVVGLTAFGTVVKGWNDFKKFSLKVDMCRFVYTTYEKTLIELKTYVRGLPLEEFDGFLIRMQTLDEVITDFTPPMFDRVIRQYPQKFHHKPIDEALNEHKCVCRKLHLHFHRNHAFERRRTIRRRRMKKMRGGLLPLAALIPALIAGRKAAALGAAGGAASYGAKKALEAVTGKRRRRP